VSHVKEEEIVHEIYEIEYVAMSFFLAKDLHVSKYASANLDYIRTTRIKSFDYNDHLKAATRRAETSSII
jgi:hypothetical protein